MATSACPRSSFRAGAGRRTSSAKDEPNIALLVRDLSNLGVRGNSRTLLDPVMVREECCRSF